MLKFILSVLLFSNILFAHSSSDFFDFSSDNLKEDLQAAKEDGKKGIFIFFGMEDCPFCHKMKMTVLNKPEVIKFYKKNFANFEIDVNGNIQTHDFDGKALSHKALALKHEVRATPVLAFFDLNGKKIFTRTGYSSLEEFILLGNFITSGKYKTDNFVKYKRDMLTK